VLRAPSIDARERSADWEQIEDLQSRFGENGCFDIQMDGSNKDVVLKAAAQVLATWYCHSQIWAFGDKLYVRSKDYL
jgi:Mg-chelatase subunit ChlI